MTAGEFVSFQRERITRAVEAIADLAAVRNAYDALGGNTAGQALAVHFTDDAAGLTNVVNAVVTADKLLAAIRGESASLVNGDHTNLFKITSTF